MKYHIFILLLLFLTLLGGCGGTSSNYMAFDEVVYVEQFPHTFSLSNETEFELSIIGNKDFIIYDTLLIVTTSQQTGFWAFYSLPDHRELGEFNRRGNGPNEFAEIPFVSQATLFKEGNTLFAGMRDFPTGKVYKMNINESLKENRLNISLLNDSLPLNLFNFILLNDSTFFCREISYDRTQQIRYLLKNREKIIPPSFEKLNQVHIEAGEDFNLLSTGALRNVAGDRIVEIPIRLNHINLYSIDGSFYKTICVEKEIDNINKIQYRFEWDRKCTYADIRVYKDFFGALYINENMGTRQIKRKKLPCIQLFNWEGDPIAEFKLNRHITSFDIDFVHGHLYTFDLETDEFCKYDIQDILEAI
ncbi:hypothetical protein M2137_002420 [Parabacteroides sp. PFB2-10]|uniref:hypothetical protein n=1 Tax=Parabacteroides sp. PFB2-10 TaxID=1742405 RepID=UPI002473C488|nr:hypothetical protein [Parabacteroides sp. PFB2-10]MDH6313630.1 hypothetical protein [Parabacteroides sp. PFB2-10]MDL2245418.1 TolB-like 6-bladed beta-propeller domain-containing protein [Parabacteroides sp. OttesenSCG-928-J18]